ncbi:MAG: hypothetical protein IIU65_03790, partial [Clostridia bacterium]|nr:hypothetical protein [Clostridia bacterium]
VPCNRGFVFAEIHKQNENGEEKNVIGFNQYSFDSASSTPITKSTYLNYLFLNHSDFLKEEIGDYINIITVFTPSFGTIMISPNGIAKMYDYNCRFKWRGNLKYKGFAPSDAVIYGDELWCAYPESNTLIRYNANSMRQEFKISSGIGEELVEPYGLFAIDDSLVITSQNSGVVRKMSLIDYKLETLFEFGEPIKKYIKIDSNEVVLTKSGIYTI